VTAGPAERARTRFEAPDDSSLQRFAAAAGRLARGKPAFSSGAVAAPSAAVAGLEFREFREYQPGDDAHRIDWRASARTHNPVIRQYRSELAANWCICLDDSASMAVVGGAKWRLAATLASACAYLLIHGGHRVGLLRFAHSVDDFVPLAQGREQYLRMLQTLRQRSAERSGSGATRLSPIGTVAPQAAHLIIVTDGLLQAQGIAELARLRRPGRRIQLLQILDRNEGALPAGARRELVDVETGERRWTLREASARDAIDALCTMLDEYCRRYGIVRTLGFTAQNWQDILTAHLQRLDRV
jgi:uncharacterized protein (DUF58 family)